MTTSPSDGRAPPRGRRRSRSWCLALVLLLGACDLVPALSGPPRDVADHVPIAVLQVSGSYLGAELEVRDHAWRIGLRRTGDDEAAGSGDGDAAGSGNGAGSTTEADVVTGRLLDADGGVLVEAHHRIEASVDEGGDAGDIVEPGTFGLHLGVEDPSEVVTLQVEAGGDLHEEHAEGTVGVGLGEIPTTLRDAIDVSLATDGDPERVQVELHGDRVSGRALPVHDGTFRLDPSRYGRGVAHVVALVTDGLAADLTHATTEIDVEFEEHLDIHLDRGDGPIRVSAGERYLILQATVTHNTSPSTARAESPSPWTVTFTSDVDGPLDEVDLSPGHPELYVDVTELTPGTHIITVSATGDGMAAELAVEVHIER